jgi:hypothetical protein
MGKYLWHVRAAPVKTIWAKKIPPSGGIFAFSGEVQQAVF